MSLGQTAIICLPLLRHGHSSLKIKRMELNQLEISLLVDLNLRQVWYQRFRTQALICKLSLTCWTMIWLEMLLSLDHVFCI